MRKAKIDVLDSLIFQRFTARIIGSHDDFVCELIKNLFGRPYFAFFDFADSAVFLRLLNRNQFSIF